MPAHTGKTGWAMAPGHSRRTVMSTKLPNDSLNSRLEREVERERHERQLHDERRAGLAVDEEFRNKDVREQAGAVGLKRSMGR
jgi:hypothetical protein